MRILFMGSSSFACRSLDRLISDRRHEIACVVTQPARPKGRSLHIQSSEVRNLADSVSLPVLTPENVNTRESVSALAAFLPEVAVVVAYGQILRRRVLLLPSKGCVNIHASLLPRYRGAAPIQWAIARGESVTGVTTMFMNAGMDEGDILMQREERIAPEDTGGSLHDKLARIGADLIAETLSRMEAGSLSGQPQDPRMATYAPKLAREDGRIDWRMAPDEIKNRIRAFNPWPGSFCRIGSEDGMLLKVLAVESRVGAEGIADAGTVVAADEECPVVSAGGGTVRLLEVQPEGKRAMAGAAFMRGYRLTPGVRLV